MLACHSPVPYLFQSLLPLGISAYSNPLPYWSPVGLTWSFFSWSRLVLTVWLLFRTLKLESKKKKKKLSPSASFALCRGGNWKWEMRGHMPKVTTWQNGGRITVPMMDAHLPGAAQQTHQVFKYACCSWLWCKHYWKAPSYALSCSVLVCSSDTAWRFFARMLSLSKNGSHLHRKKNKWLLNIYEDIPAYH